ncbi:GNAT family N-acetyltransferase [Metabacillus halosaccharovorans]|uniref:GNAT family N-acetyltransferase n=1 Tax=Metabacillus halosaccharovorans TaxID=930124 RepID=UPI001FE6AA4C|nr:GNAT family N-acetyltransferase [Metabacillus halosaccharovorans]
MNFEGEIVGCAGGEISSLIECEIKHIAVSSVQRGKGIGMINYITEHRYFDFEITSLGEKYPGVERFLWNLKRNDLFELMGSDSFTRNIGFQESERNC